MPFIPAGRDRLGFGAKNFIPFNDAQWTTSQQGYGIALRSRGVTAYYDASSFDPLAGPGLDKIKALFQLTGKSLWLVVAAPSYNELPSAK
jgi:hypothetical protein